MSITNAGNQGYCFLHHETPAPSSSYKPSYYFQWLCSDTHPPQHCCGFKHCPPLQLPLTILYCSHTYLLALELACMISLALDMLYGLCLKSSQFACRLSSLPLSEDSLQLAGSTTLGRAIPTESFTETAFTPAALRQDRGQDHCGSSVHLPHEGEEPVIIYLTKVCPCSLESRVSYCLPSVLTWSTEIKCSISSYFIYKKIFGCG